MMDFKIYTSSWFTALPPGTQKIGISRGTPRGYHAGFYRMMRELAPGAYFNTVTPAEYHRLYMEQLARLSAREVLAKIRKLGGGADVAEHRAGGAQARPVCLWLNQWCSIGGLIPPRERRVDASGSERPGGEMSAIIATSPHPTPSAPPSPRGEKGHHPSRSDSD